MATLWTDLPVEPFSQEHTLVVGCEQGSDVPALGVPKSLDGHFLIRPEREIQARMQSSVSAMLHASRPSFWTILGVVLAQISLSDRLILNKTDLIPEDERNWASLGSSRSAVGCGSYRR